MIAEIRREVKYGADWIKLYATGTLRHVDPVTLESLSQVSLEDVKAVVAEAARWHRDVAAHAYGGDGAKNAIRGGVRSIEHGMLMDDEALKLLVEHGTFWCPTLSVYLPESAEDDTEMRRRIVAHHKEVFQKAMRDGREDLLRHGRRRVRARHLGARVREDGRVRNEADRCDPLGDDSRGGVAEDGKADRHNRDRQATRTSSPSKAIRLMTSSAHSHGVCDESRSGLQDQMSPSARRFTVLKISA